MMYVATSDSVGAVGFGVIPGDVLVTGVYACLAEAQAAGPHVRLLPVFPSVSPSRGWRASGRVSSCRNPKVGERLATYCEGNDVYALQPKNT